MKTRVVHIGKVKIGGNNPIRIQSMTTTPTCNVIATIDQICKLQDHGCEIVRVAIQGKKEALSCEAIKNGLQKRGYDIPLVADVHFYPPAAFIVCQFVDKVRINPGNFIRNPTLNCYQNQLEDILVPLLEECKKWKSSIRIGVNHGSLSNHLLERLGNTPKGMVHSALEYGEICRKNNFHEFIFSMKASSPLIMIEAYRLLADEMIRRGWNYPLHLGVTEAGINEDGRVKSAIGIGTLLLEGLGDTIRVSLTEDPIEEILAAKRLINFYTSYYTKRTIYQESKKKKKGKKHSKDKVPPFLIVCATSKDLLKKNFYRNINCNIKDGKLQKTISSPDGILLEDLSKEVLSKIPELKEAGIKVFSNNFHKETIPLINIEHIENLPKEKKLAILTSSLYEKTKDTLLSLAPLYIFFSPKQNRLDETRGLANWLKDNRLPSHLILYFDYSYKWEDLIIYASSEMGAIFCDKLANGIVLRSTCTLKQNLFLSASILQGCGLRTSKTEFVSCPGCGRTLFDIQKVSQRIQKKLSHLPGVKIAIMGCIVNGPGEMADADFGYVGSKPGKIDLYVGKTRVQKDINMDVADDILINLIKSHSKWIDPHF